MLLLITLLACGPDPTEPQSQATAPAPRPTVPTVPPTEPATTPDPVEPTVQVLSAPQHLVRASMMLRGVLPSEAELDQVRDDPEALPGVVDDYLDSPEFGDVVRQAHGVWWLTETYRDYYPGGFYAFGPLSSLDDNAVNDAVQQAPGRLAQHVVENDLPYSDVVLADYTLADRTVATVWGLPYDVAQEGWQVARFDDGRPMAGLLTDPWYFVRHASTDTNRQRARAGHLSRALLCHDYMRREVRVPEDVDLTAGGNNAIEDNPVCVSCHNTLDPLGAFFAPFEGVVVPQATFRYPVDTWDASRSDDYMEPRYYGEPATDVVDLAGLIAEDPRFARCAVRRFYGEMLAVDADDVAATEVDRFLPDFLASGLQVKPLLRSIVLDEAFAAAAPVDPTAEGTADVAGLRRITPWHLERTIADLTGYTWQSDLPYGFYGRGPGVVNLLEDITWGYRTLGGGADGFERWDPLRTVDPTSVLVLRNLLAHVVPPLVADELAADPGDRQLLTRLGSDPTDEAAAREQLAALHWRLYGDDVASDGEAVDAGYALFAQVLASGGPPERAWTVLLTALLSDPRLMFV